MRMRIPFRSGLLALAISIGGLSAQDKTATWSTPSDIGELIAVLTDKLPGTTETELVRAALSGIQAELGSQVDLGLGERIADEEGGAAAKDRGRMTVVDGQFAWIQLKEVFPGLDEFFLTFWREVGKDGLKGVLLDLRGCRGGSDLKPVVDFLSCFLKEKVDLIQINDQVWRGTPRPGRVDAPAVVLVDEKTSGPAEVLAYLFKEQRLGIIVGGKTAGQAKARESLTLSSGVQIWLPSAAVALAGGRPIPPGGIEPDLLVEKSLDPGARSNERGGDQDRMAAKDIKDQAVTRGLDLLRGIVLMRGSGWNGFPH